MALSSDLISQFVQVTKEEKQKKETTTYGTMVDYDGKQFVKLDGSELLTPISTTVDALDGDRVIVMIKDHNAIVTGNISSPAARNDAVVEANGKIDAYDTLVANKVSTDRFEAEVARIDTLVSENVTIKKSLSANEADIKNLSADTATINKKLTAVNADIDSLDTKKLDTEIADITYATIENLDAAQARINNIEATYGDFQDLTAIKADITDLKTDKLSATDADLKYANIDFTNINMAAVQKVFSDSGIIQNLIVSEGKITGELVGVTIKGDLIEGNTVVADKLVVKGQNGLYYKLNTDGVTTEAEQTDYNSLKGTIIQAKSITAEKIAVDDLVAFGATIGGFNITASAIFSGVKENPLNTTNGVYLDSIGQFSVGDSNNYIRYYKTDDDEYKLEISSDTTILVSRGKSLEAVISDLEEQTTTAAEEANRAQDTADSAQQTADNAETLIKQLSDSISMLVTDGNGSSLMTQTEDGWVFSTAEIQAVVDATSEGLDSLINELGSTNNTVDVLQQAVDDLGLLADYIVIGTYEDQPCIELGETDSEFKLRITNTQVVYTEGSTVLAYFTNQAVHIKKAVIEEELQQGGFVWKVRSNGNMGLVWKGVSS